MLTCCGTRFRLRVILARITRFLSSRSPILRGESKCANFDPDMFQCCRMCSVTYQTSRVYIVYRYVSAKILCLVTSSFHRRCEISEIDPHPDFNVRYSATGLQLHWTQSAVANSCSSRIHHCSNTKYLEVTSIV